MAFFWVIFSYMCNKDDHLAMKRINIASYPGTFPNKMLSVGLCSCIALSIKLEKAD